MLGTGTASKGTTTEHAATGYIFCGCQSLGRNHEFSHHTATGMADIDS